MTMRATYVVSVLFTVIACGGGESGGSAGNASGGTSASGGNSGSSGSANGGQSPGTDPFAGVELKPDVDTTPVADCAGQPDMTLCSVVTTPDRWYDICVGGTCVSPGCGEVSCSAPAPHFSIPPNTDHSHFHVFPGAEPVVVDLVTGLHWQGCSVGRSGPACAEGTAQTLTWDEAVAYCDALSWGAKSDWYLPDSYELLSILDWGKGGNFNGALDSSLFPASPSWYWTSHFVSDNSVFTIQFSAATSFALSTITDSWRDKTISARCVRRGFSRDAGYVDQRFVVSAAAQEKTIQDTATGLVWQGCVAGRSGPSCGAGSITKLATSEWVAHCESLSWGGFSDWRLPTFKELHSLVEYPPLTTYSEPEIDDSVFDVDNGPYLAARSGWQDGAVPMLIDVHDGNRVGPGSGGYPVLCVRGY